MPNYFVMECMGKPETLFFALETEVSNGECWAMGRQFSSDNGDSDFHPPAGVIDLDTRIDSKVRERVYPEYMSNPLPLMSRRLVAALQEAGVDNIQVYETKLINPQGSLPITANYYQAVNILGLVAAADLGASKTNPEVKEKMISMDFHSLTIDELKARDVLMFRLAENVSAVMVHEHVREFVEGKGIDTLTWYKSESWVG